MVKKSFNSGMVLRVIISAVLVCIIGLLYLRLVKPQQPLFVNPLDSIETHISQTRNEVKLPANWSFSDSTEENIDWKIERTSDYAAKPTVILLHSVLSQNRGKSYIDNLIKGVRSTLPSLEINSDTEEDRQGAYVRKLEGSFSVNNVQMSIIQWIAVKQDVMYTITGVYDAREPQVIADETRTVISSIETNLTK